MDTRAALRRAMREQRRALPATQRRQFERQLATRLSTHPLFLRSRHVAFYLACDGEVDLKPLVERARSMGKRCYLPVLAPACPNRLWFAPWRPGERLVPNRFGILEPKVPWRAMRRPWTLDLVLTPLVAFDDQGHRLGMGGGFYDRTFAYLQRHRHWRSPTLLGIAFGFQQQTALPAETWDVPLAGVATEGGVRT